MNEPIAIKLKTLISIWTGSVDSKRDRLHTTGIIGQEFVK